MTCFYIFFIKRKNTVCFRMTSFMGENRAAWPGGTKKFQLLHPRRPLSTPRTFVILTESRCSGPGRREESVEAIFYSHSIFTRSLVIRKSFKLLPFIRHPIAHGIWFFHKFHHITHRFHVFLIALPIILA